MSPNLIQCNGTEHISIEIDVFVYEEDGFQIAFCPALELSAFGETKEEAIKSFETTIKLHFEYLIENNTLEADLMEHGWTFEKKPEPKLIPPVNEDFKPEWWPQIYNNPLTTKQQITVACC